MLPHTTKRRKTTNLKTTNNEECQKIKLTTKELKKHPPRPVGGAEMGDREGQPSKEDTRQSSGLCRQGRAS